jgi:hypothetical protein
VGGLPRGNHGGDLSHYAFNIADDICVRHPQNLHAAPGKPVIAPRIRGRIVMGRPIHLDHELRGGQEEIRDERPERHLSPHAHPKLCLPQGAP